MKEGGRSAFTRQLQMKAPAISSAAPDVSPGLSDIDIGTSGFIGSTQSAPEKANQQLINLFWARRLDHVLACLYIFVHL